HMPTQASTHLCVATMNQFTIECWSQVVDVERHSGPHHRAIIVTNLDRHRRGKFDQVPRHLGQDAQSFFLHIVEVRKVDTFLVLAEVIVDPHVEVIAAPMVCYPVCWAMRGKWCATEPHAIPA